MKKIRYHFVHTKTEEKHFQLDRNRKVRIFLVKESPAKHFLGNIYVTDHFFEKFNEEEQKAIIYHELFHKKNTTQILRTLKTIWYMSEKKAIHEEELRADRYAAKNAGKEPVISFLKKLKEMSKQGILVPDKKTHPSIDKRIDAIKSLK